MSRTVFLINQGDRLPAFEAILVETVDGVESPVDLTDATAAWFILRKKCDDTPVFRKAMTIETPKTAGMVTYAWADGDTAAVGKYEAKIEVTFPSGPWSFPTRGYLPVTILEDGE